MYDNDNVSYRVGINFKDVILKIILLVLFIVLLCWLFPKAADLDVFYDSVYRENVNTMKEAARNYYTVDRLPKNVGEQSSMTLKEMVDNKMLIRFTDKNGKTCDESSSKVEVTKLSETEYSLKVKLTCDSQDDYIIETIGCTNICSNGTCQMVINNSNNSSAVVGDNSANNNVNANSNVGNSATTERDDTDYSVGYDPKTGEKLTTILYQHRKAIITTKTVYTCPEGYTKNGTKCTKLSTGATIDATPVYNPDQTITTDAKLNTGEDIIVRVDPIKTEIGTDYSCPTGYTLNGSYCIKYTDATETPGATTYTCPTGYTLNGTICNKTYTATYTQGSTSYSCPNGGTLNGTICTITQGASSTTEYTCPSGYTKNGSSCYKVYNASSSTTYSCPNGGTLSGTKCVTSSSYNATPSTKYSCPNGGTLSGTTCTKSSSYAATASTSYGNWVNAGTKYYTSSAKAYTGTTSKLVLQGAISGAVCGSPCGNSGIWYKYIYYTRSATTKYSCPNGGTLSGTNCVTTSSYAATASTTYSCPNGGTLSGTKCNTSSSYNATPSTKYSCPNGGTLSGTQCTITTNATATTKYSCPTGYTLNGSTCTKTYNATPSTGNGYYSCPNGGTLNGTICTISQSATPHTGETTYSCPTGYTLNQQTKKCEYKIDATATKRYSYTCPEGYTKAGEGENTTCTKVTQGEGTYYCEDSEAVLTGTKCVKTIKGTIKYYTCPEGYTLDGTKCTKQTTETIDATVSTTSSTSYQYKWSESSYLEGWEFTGKTKTQTYTAGQK